MAEKKSEVQSMWEALSQVAAYGDPRQKRREELTEGYHGKKSKKHNKAEKEKMEEMEEGVDPVEAIVFEFLESFVGDSLNESSSEEDHEEAIVEAVANLNNLCALVNGYFGTEEAYDHAINALYQD